MSDGASPDREISRPLPAPGHRARSPRSTTRCASWSPTWSRPCTPRTAPGWPRSRSGPTKRIFIVEASVAGGDENDHPLVFINPKIEWLSDETETSDEGCLSFPGIYVPIKRSLRARVRATGLDGKEFVAEGEGLYARAMQHENDHLINKLLIDYVGPLKRQMIKRKMERMTDEEADELQALGE